LEKSVKAVHYPLIVCVQTMRGSATRDGHECGRTTRRKHRVSVPDVYSNSRLVVTGLLALPGLMILFGTDDADLALQRYVGKGTEALGSVFRVGMLFLTGAVFHSLLRKPWRPLS